MGINKQKAGVVFDQAIEEDGGVEDIEAALRMALDTLADFESMNNIKAASLRITILAEPEMSRLTFEQRLDSVNAEVSMTAMKELLDAIERSYELVLDSERPIRALEIKLERARNHRKLLNGEVNFFTVHKMRNAIKDAKKQLYYIVSECQKYTEGDNN